MSGAEMLLLAAVGGAGASLGFILGVLRHGRQRLKVIERRIERSR